MDDIIAGTTRRRRGGIAALLAALTWLACPPVVAQALPSQAELAAQAARRFPQPVRVGDLLQRTVLKPVESQDVIGHVQHVIRGADGGIRVVMSYGGLLGIGAHPIAVPVEAVVLVGKVLEVVGLTPAQLQGLPAYAGDGVTLPADAVIRVGLAKPSH